MLLRNYIKHFKLPALQQAVSYKHLHNQVEQCGLEKRTCDTDVQSAVLVAVCRNAAKRERTTTRKEITRSYYDRTNTSILAQLPNSFTPDPLTQRKRIVHVTYEAVYDSNDATYNHATHYDYDIHGNVKTLLQDNADLGALNQLASQRFKRMDYTFDLISGNVHRVDYETNKADQWHHAYSYDADNRITAVYTTSATPLVNDALAMSSLQNEPLLNPTWEKEAAYSYYAHGPLARTVIGEQEVQGLDYVYTLQGWIKGVNSNNLDANNDPGKDGLGLSANHRVAQDVMGYSLQYFNNDYLPIVNGNTTFIADQTNSDMLQNSSDLYNGNIARMVTTITDPNSRAVLPLGNAYQYDQLNRLKHAVSFDQLNGNAWAGGAPAKYENSFTYDANGNILTQTRNDDNNQVIDELAYFYPKNAANKTVRNRLLYVSDNVDYDASDIDPGMATSNYAYDEEGRLIQDLQEGIDEINWRVDGKVKSIKQSDNKQGEFSLSFDYDAMGHRIAKHSYDKDQAYNNGLGQLVKSTYYVLDAQGNTMATYERSIDNGQTSLTFAQTEKFIYGSARLGVQNVNIGLLGSQNNTYTQTTVPHRIGKKGYELSNHLGNVLSVISDKAIPHNNGGGVVDYFLADIRQAQDYSPFGVLLQNRNLSLSGANPYRYFYQGSEMDKEVKGDGNSYTTTFRQLDPRLGKWLTIDPKAISKPWESTYGSMGNNPIWRNDKLGDVFDEKSQVVVNDHKISTNKLLDKAKARENFLTASETSLTKVQKEELESVRNSIKEFENSLLEIAEMEESSQEFNLKMITETDPRYRKGVRGNTANLDGKVLIEYSSTSTLAHELKHGSQFIRGELGFDKATNLGGYLHDANDEQQAYQRESAYVNYRQFKIFTADDIRTRNDNYKLLMNGPLGVESTIEQVFRGRSPEYNVWLDGLTPELRSSKFKSNAEVLEEIIFISK